jgi:thioredoxin-dependent peroxiredoxin
MRKILLLSSLFSFSAMAADITVGQLAPTFKLKNQAGQDFDLSTLKGKGKWTVLYFYPKSETPGCTKQACAFRDNIAKVREQKAEVYGVSVNSVKDQLGFHEHHHLVFDLLADEDGKVTDLYGAKMPIIRMAKRWTFLLDPDLKVRAIDRSVDPVKDAEHVAAKLKELQAQDAVAAAAAAAAAPAPAPAK